MSILDDNLKKTSWPSKKNSLFSERKDWWNVAHLEIASVAEGLAIYAQSYKDAGDRLVEYAKSDKTSINILVFPILFLYRHYLELALKEIIIAATKYLEKGHNNVFSKHNLSQLWNRTKELISEIKIDIPNNDLNAVEYQILQFDRLDSSSQKFRYPVGNNGDVFVNISNSINIENVREIINGLWAWCFGIVCVLGEYEEAKINIDIKPKL